MNRCTGQIYSMATEIEREELASQEPNGYRELCVWFCVWAGVRGPVGVSLGGRADGRLGEGGVWVGHKDFIPKLK